MTTTTLTAGAGSYSISGQPALGTYAIHGSPYSGVSAAGSYTIAGSAISVLVSFAPVKTAYAISGGAGSFKIAIKPVVGAFSISGKTLTVHALSLAITGNAAHFTRDFVNWYTVSPPTTTWTPDNIQTIPPPVNS
jgi:hypothetical protein